ncbi:MAG TPA: hypothetical protein VKX17_13825 [Planctomycetota bacterium]|nr:hypothetical protein [Planctomycetota bacterium]
MAFVQSFLKTNSRTKSATSLPAAFDRARNVDISFGVSRKVNFTLRFSEFGSAGRPVRALSAAISFLVRMKALYFMSVTKSN